MHSAMFSTSISMACALRVGAGHGGEGEGKGKGEEDANQGFRGLGEEGKAGEEGEERKKTRSRWKNGADRTGGQVGCSTTIHSHFLILIWFYPIPFHDDDLMQSLTYTPYLGLGPRASRVQGAAYREHASRLTGFGRLHLH